MVQDRHSYSLLGSGFKIQVSSDLIYRRHQEELEIKHFFRRNSTRGSSNEIIDAIQHMIRSREDSREESGTRDRLLDLLNDGGIFSNSFPSS